MNLQVYIIPSLYLLSLPLISLLLKRLYSVHKYAESLKFVKQYDVSDVDELKFNGYVKDFNKKYTGEEYEQRFLNFKASLREIARLNAIEGATVFGLTKFSDMSKAEFAKKMLMKPSYLSECLIKHRVCPNGEESVETRNHTRFGDDPPTNFDWRDKGFVSPVLEQKRCLGCWAFSIIGVMETMAAKNGIEHQRRSIQELIDCSKYNNGCNGGKVLRALDFLCQKSKVIVTEKEYPLTLSGEKICKIQGDPIGRRLKEFTTQCNVDPDLMVSQVVNHGPLVASVDASTWMNYLGGIIQRACPQVVSNHVVQIVGYANYKTDDTPYFIIRNSYGEDFGDHGYVKIALYGNACGITNQVALLDVM